MVFGTILQKVEKKLHQSDATSRMVKQLEEANPVVETFKMVQSDQDALLEQMNFTNNERKLFKRYGINNKTELLTAIMQLDIPLDELTHRGKELRLGILSIIKEFLIIQRNAIFEMIDYQPFTPRDPAKAANISCECTNDSGVKYKYNPLKDSQIIPSLTEQELRHDYNKTNYKNAYIAFENIINLLIVQTKHHLGGKNIYQEYEDTTPLYVVIMILVAIILVLFLKT